MSKVNDIVIDNGAVRDPNGFYMLTEQELWAYSVEIIGQAWLRMHQDPNTSMVDLIDSFKE
jgi:hypothetical protein